MNRNDNGFDDYDSAEQDISVAEYDVSLEDAGLYHSSGTSGNGPNLNYYQRVMQAKRNAEADPSSDRNINARTDAFEPQNSPGYNAASRRGEDRFYDEDYAEEDRRYAGRGSRSDYYEDDYCEDPGDDYDFGMGSGKKKKRRSDRSSGNRSSEGSGRKKKKKSHPIRTLFLLLLLAVLVICGIMYAALSRIDHVDSVADGSADVLTEADGYTTLSSPFVTNILLVGQDARSGEEQTRTDSMIICSINKASRGVSLVSLMRDSYVAIPGYGWNRLNAAYVYGGMELLDVAVQENFGIDINGNCIIDLDGFLSAMTGVGNVDIELTQEEADYMNANPSLGSSVDPEEITEIELWSLTAGVNSLTPEQALCYCRMREVGNSDWDRTLRQRTFLSAAIAKFKHSDPVTQYRVLSSVSDSLTTDMATKDLVLAGLSGLLSDTSDMKSYQVPAEGTYYGDMIDGAAVLVIDFESNREYLKNWLYSE